MIHNTIHNAALLNVSYLYSLLNQPFPSYLVLYLTIYIHS